MEKYLILKLDEGTLLHLPEYISETPCIFDPSIPEEKIQEYSQIKLIGSEWDLKTLEDLMFPKYANQAVVLKYIQQILDNLAEEEQVALKEKFTFLKEFDKIAINDYRREISVNKSSS